MSARPTSADVLRVIGNDDEMRDAARVAAVLAMDGWTPHPGTSPAPNGWIGGQVRDTLPDWLDAALGTWDDADVDGDPTGEIGAAMRPRAVGDVTTREALDALLPGALLLDKDGYVLVKEEWHTRGADGSLTWGHEYRVLHDPMGSGRAGRGAVFAADEIAGDYAEPGSGSSFLPGRAYVIGGVR